jgi:hypothetical protein
MRVTWLDEEVADMRANKNERSFYSAANSPPDQNPRKK